MIPAIDIHILLVARGEWQFRLVMLGEYVVTADDGESFGDPGKALAAAWAAIKAERYRRQPQRDEG